MRTLGELPGVLAGGKQQQHRKMLPVYALAIWCDPELAPANDFAGSLAKSGCQDSHEDPDFGHSQRRRQSNSSA